MPQSSPALLVVDDDDTNRNLLARFFQSKGFQVDTASLRSRRLPVRPPRASDSVSPLFRGPVQAAFRELLQPAPVSKA